MGKQWKQLLTLYFGASKSLQMVTAAMKLKDACSLEGKFDQHRQHIKKQRHYFTDKDPYSQSHVFPDVTDGCESWTIKNGIKLSAEELMLLNCGVGEDS